jgi:hypothetical protein
MPIDAWAVTVAVVLVGVAYVAYRLGYENAITKMVDNHPGMLEEIEQARETHRIMDEGDKHE